MKPAANGYTSIDPSLHRHEELRDAATGQILYGKVGAYWLRVTQAVAAVEPQVRKILSLLTLCCRVAAS